MDMIPLLVVALVARLEVAAVVSCGSEKTVRAPSVQTRPLTRHQRTMSLQGDGMSSYVGTTAIMALLWCTTLNILHFRLSWRSTQRKTRYLGVIVPLSHFSCILWQMTASLMVFSHFHPEITQSSYIFNPLNFVYPFLPNADKPNQMTSIDAAKVSFDCGRWFTWACICYCTALYSTKMTYVVIYNIFRFNKINVVNEIKWSPKVQLYSLFFVAMCTLMNVGQFYGIRGNYLYNEGMVEDGCEITFDYWIGLLACTLICIDASLYRKLVPSLLATETDYSIQYSGAIAMEAFDLGLRRQHRMTLVAIFTAVLDLFIQTMFQNYNVLWLLMIDVMVQVTVNFAMFNDSWDLLTTICTTSTANVCRNIRKLDTKVKSLDQPNDNNSSACSKKSSASSCDLQVPVRLADATNTMDISIKKGGVRKKSSRDVLTRSCTRLKSRPRGPPPPSPASENPPVAPSPTVKTPPSASFPSQTESGTYVSSQGSGGFIRPPPRRLVDSGQLVFHGPAMTRIHFNSIQHALNTLGAEEKSINDSASPIMGLSSVTASESYF